MQLNDTEQRAVEEIVTKEPTELWPEAAKRVGISERQLRNIRHKVEVQEAVYKVSKELFKTDLPDVLKMLTKKAKAGEAWAVKLFLEVAGELKEVSNPTSEIYDGVRGDQLRKDAERALEILRAEELSKQLDERNRVSYSGN